MNPTVLTQLVTRKLINTNTELTCKYKGATIDGRAMANEQAIILVNNISFNEDLQKYVFTGKSTFDGSAKQFDQDQIVEIDGMDPNRFARVFGISPVGGTIKEGKRRGRKPKNRIVEETFDIDDEDEDDEYGEDQD